jgi:hypothetical protein
MVVTAAGPYLALNGPTGGPRRQRESRMTGQLNHFVAIEQIADRHRAADLSRLAARVPETREPAERSVRRGRSRFGLRRPKLA